MISEKLCRRCGETKIAAEFNKDDRYSDGIGSWCRECHRDRNSQWAKENRERLTQKARVWRGQNGPILSLVNIRCKTKHKERYAKQHAEWAKANRSKRCATNAKRKAAKLRATPAWADFDSIAVIYAECASITEQTGVQHHVDHIVPLQNKLVCGLHCENNLRVITASENVRKKNKWISDAYKQGDFFIEKPKPVKPEPFI